MKVQINIIGETKQGMSYLNQSLISALNRKLWHEEIEARSAGIALYVGRRTGLKDRTLEFFVNFITQRFSQERSECYIMEWATRLLSGTAWAAADNESRAVLLSLAREMNLKNIPDEWSECT